MPIDAEEWRAIRHCCYQQVREVATTIGAGRAIHAYELQERVMRAIMTAEKSGETTDSRDLKRHLHCLRLCVDAIAFLLLHPHTIRQLGKNPGNPPRLSSQEDSCRHALAVAKEYADQGVPALISDLSNLLRISDVVVCDDLEQPTLIECKSHISQPSFLKQGRRGRQISRALGMQSYIQHGAAKVFGETTPRLAVETNVLRQKSQSTIERVVDEAMSSGSSHEYVSPFDLVICVRPAPDVREVNMEPYLPLLDGFRQVLIGSYACALWNPGMLIPPAIIWDLDFEPAAALMEEELLLIHAIDVMRFSDIVYEDFRVVRVVLRSDDSEGAHIETLGEGGTGVANISFVDDVLFWYYTIESTVEALRELHQQSLRALSNAEHQRARCIDPSRLSVEQLTSSPGQASEGGLMEPGSYRIRLSSGSEFVINTIDDEEAKPPTEGA